MKNKTHQLKENVYISVCECVSVSTGALQGQKKVSDAGAGITSLNLT